MIETDRKYFVHRAYEEFVVKVSTITLQRLGIHARYSQKFSFGFALILCYPYLVYTYPSNCLLDFVFQTS